MCERESSSETCCWVGARDHSRLMLADVGQELGIWKTNYECAKFLYHLLLHRDALDDAE